MNEELPVKRCICGQCGFPMSVCICDLIPCLAGHVTVWILQDKLEIKHAKNTARLLALCYAQTKLVDVSDIQQLNTFFQTVTPDQGILLYPDERAVMLEQCMLPVRAQVKHLILLDGTWRKAKKMLLMFPELARYPKATFESPPPSQYDIRKAPNIASLSTLEAGAYALKLLSSDAEYHQITTFFQQVLGRQWSKQPDHHKHK